MNKYNIITTIILAFTLLTGCGIKPSKLSPPVDAEKSEYPRVYPDISTDPK